MQAAALMSHEDLTSQLLRGIADHPIIEFSTTEFFRGESSLSKISCGGPLWRPLRKKKHLFFRRNRP